MRIVVATGAVPAVQCRQQRVQAQGSCASKTLETSTPQATEYSHLSEGIRCVLPVLYSKATPTERVRLQEVLYTSFRVYIVADRLVHQILNDVERQKPSRYPTQIDTIDSQKVGAISGAQQWGESFGVLQKVTRLS